MVPRIDEIFPHLISLVLQKFSHARRRRQPCSAEPKSAATTLACKSSKTSARARKPDNASSPRSEGSLATSGTLDSLCRFSKEIIALKPPVVPKLASVQPGLDVGDRLIPRHSRIACMLRQRRRLPVARIQRGGSAALAQLFHRVLDFSIRQDVQQFLGARTVKPRTEYRAPARLSRAPLQSSVVLQR